MSATSWNRYGQTFPLKSDFDYIWLGISVGLGTLFGEVEAAERLWLAQPRRCWGGRSANDLLENRRSTDARRVMDLLDDERGLRWVVSQFEPGRD